MNRTYAVAIAVALLAGCGEQTAVMDPMVKGTVAEQEVGDGHDGNTLTVMTYNVYYGADYTPLLGASLDQVPFVAAQAWAAAQATDFPGRAGRIAAIIAANGPDLVGLEEAAIYRVQHPGDAIVGGSTPATDVVYDMVALIRDSLAARGLDYQLVAADSTTDIELPVFTGLDGDGNPTFDDVRLTDRDAILARAGVPVTNPQHGVYDAHIPVSLGPIETGVYEGWSSIETVLGGETYRFVATHLEFQGAEPVQVAQAGELLDLLNDETRPTILTGDFNSDAYGVVPGKATPSYGMMLDAGFTDTWTNPNAPRQAPGRTCCQAADLKNHQSTLDTRIDFIFTRHLPDNGGAGTIVTARRVLGDRQAIRTAGGLWPSDHGAVIATFRAPGKAVTQVADVTAR